MTTILNGRDGNLIAVPLMRGWQSPQVALPLALGAAGTQNLILEGPNGVAAAVRSWLVIAVRVVVDVAGNYTLSEYYEPDASYHTLAELTIAGGDAGVFDLAPGFIVDGNGIHRLTLSSDAAAPNLTSLVFTGAQLAPQEAP